MSENISSDTRRILTIIKKLAHGIGLLFKICIITADAMEAFELGEWNGVLAVWRVTRRMQKMSVSL